MKTKTLVFVVGTICLVLGFFLRSQITREEERTFSYDHVNVSTYGESMNFACSGVVYTYLAKGFKNGELTSAFAPSTDKLSLSFDLDTGKVKLLTVAGVEAGATEAVELSIVEDNTDTIVAIGSTGYLGPNYSVLIFNKLDLEAVWTKTADALFKSGSTQYLVCD